MEAGVADEPDVLREAGAGPLERVSAETAQGAKEAGELEEALERAADLTDREMQQALDAGVPRDQAWEEIRSHYLLMEPEAEKPDEDDNPNRPFRLLSRAIHQETQLVLEDKLDVAAKVAELNDEDRYEEAAKLYHQSGD